MHTARDNLQATVNYSNKKIKFKYFQGKGESANKKQTAAIIVQTVADGLGKWRFPIPDF